jgi:phage/plasmid-like protein (TIGR03299 family)
LEYNGQKVDQWATFRSDNGVLLGPVGKDYAVIQHAYGFDMVDALMQAQDGAHYETAGVLGKGEKVWGLADLSLSINVGDDQSKAYLLFSTSHDGSIANSFRIAFERVVCENTLMAALRAATTACFSVRHTKNFQAKLDNAKIALAGLSAEALSMEQKLNFLAGRTVTRESMETIMARLFPNEKDENGVVSYSTRTRHSLEDVLAIYELNDGNAFPEQRGTAFNLLNAFTNFTDHKRDTHNKDNGGRAESALFGSGAKLKSQAFEVIMEAANGMPVKTRTVYAPIPAIAPTASGSLLDAVLDAHGA